jgi:hypothetical protein
MHRPASLVAAVILLLIALAHLLRIVFGVTVTVNAVTVPMWPSALAMVAIAILGAWLLRERRSHSGA